MMSVLAAAVITAVAVCFVAGAILTVGAILHTKLMGRDLGLGVGYPRRRDGGGEDHSTGSTPTTR